MRIFAIAIVVVLTFTFSLAFGDQPIVIAHRGASGYLPEHTLSAKALAIGMEADFVEQDLVLSKDGVPLVLHDIHLDGVTNVAAVFPDRKRADGRFYAIDFTLAEIKQLSVNERMDVKSGKPAFPSRFPAGTTGLKVSTLAEELQLIQGFNRSSALTKGTKTIGVYPEIKKPAWHREQGQDISAIVLKILRENGYQTRKDPCWLQCFEWSEVKRIRNELNWDGRLVQLIGSGNQAATQSDYDAMRTPAGLDELAKVVDAVGPELGAIFTIADGKAEPSPFTKLAHDRKLQVHPFTVRADEVPVPFGSLDVLHEKLFVEAGVDGVFTDFPDKTAKYIADNKIWLTKIKSSEVIKLWPATPPGRIAAKGVERDTSNADSRKVEGRWVTRIGDVSSPVVTFYPAENAKSGTVVLVCPGGGYNILAYDLEGTEVCQWLNSIGVHAAVLKYRVPRVDKEIPIEPLQDAQRAISILRARATDFGIKPDRIGILGFSAGGHLSARASTNFETRSYDSMDKWDEASCRPDFSLLIYPAYLFDKNKESLISTDLPVSNNTPPMFLTMALDDPIDAENVLRMTTALKQAKVSCELHLFPSGGHGYGLRPNKHEATRWPTQATLWLQSRGLLSE